MKKVIVLMVLLSTAAVSFGELGILDHAVGVRSNLWFDNARDATTIAAGVDTVSTWNWNQNAAMADFNGDGIDDKVLFQGSGGGLQTVVSYNAAGDISNTNLDIIGGGDWNWYTGVNPGVNAFGSYGDINGDGIADNGMITSGDVINGTTGDDTMMWQSWFSAGPGIASGTTFSGNSPFGVMTDIGLTGDMNGDGFDDRVLIRDMGGWQDIIIDYGFGWYGDGIGDVFSAIPLSDGVGIADLDGDGLDDIVTWTYNAGGWQDLAGHINTGAGINSNSSIWGAGGIAGDTFVFGDLGQAVPEPATMMLLGLGAIALRRKK